MASVERDYPAAWRDYRRRSYLLLGYMAGAFPLAALAGWLLMARFGTPALFFLCWALISVGMFLFSFKLWKWPCPRCGKKFHQDYVLEKLGHNNPFARRCYSCGLPKQEPGTDLLSRH